jgi:IDEAL domain
MGEKKMVGHYIAVKTFEYPIECFCPCGDHADVLIINKGDIIEVTNERKFTMANGWYFLVKINERCIFYMAHIDLEYYFIKEQLLSMLDIDLKINYLQFKINQALDTGDEVPFLNYTTEFKKINNLKGKFKTFLNRAESKSFF